MCSTDALVLGIDAGGSTSRAVVGDLRGTLLGTGRTAGGNPHSHPPEQALRQIVAAAETALSSVDPTRIRAAVLGMAGASKLTDPALAAKFDGAWRALGLNCPIRTVSDCEVAFAAGTDHATGTVLIAGTGAVAARIEQRRLAATVGGYGWLLGDEGSAFWVGREAVRETLRTIDRQGSLTSPLITAVSMNLLGSAETAPDPLRQQLITAVNAAPPIRLAELAPLVTSAATSGDTTAIGIVRQAAAFLADTAAATRRSGEATPIVLAGALLTTGNPVGDAVRAELATRAGELRTAGPGAAGAAWLAALDLLEPDHGTATELHACYLRT